MGTSLEVANWEMEGADGEGGAAPLTPDSLNSLARSTMLRNTLCGVIDEVTCGLW